MCEPSFVCLMVFSSSSPESFSKLSQHWVVVVRAVVVVVVVVDDGDLTRTFSKLSFVLLLRLWPSQQIFS